LKNFQNLIKKFINRDIYLNIKLARIVFNNRKALKSIKSFRSGTLISKSKDNYGLTKKGYDLVDKNINLRLTYMDIIPYLCNYIGNEIIYVEIGVSVLKNFYCIANNLTSSKLFAFDINTINPIIEEKFNYKKQLSNNSKSYEFNSNQITYIQGDVYNSGDLQELVDLSQQANFIFSDADHTPEGLMSEYVNYYSKCLAENFIIYFDDINSEMFETFITIYKDIEKKLSNINAYTFAINGWFGENENLHKNGIITNLDIQSKLKTDRIKLKNFKKVEY
tara:strand:- start:13961 stop:14794 length:834 start_codon:yes stop_codon:yes gene_type:complete